MAKKKATKKASSRKVRSSFSDQNSLLLIVGGGFLIIIFIGMFWGWFGGTDRFHYASKVNSQENVEKMRETVIAIQNGTFTSPVTVAKGTKITWINNDTESHSIVSDDGSFNSLALASGENKSHTFQKKGTFTYHCPLHDGMTGVIIVE